MDAIRLPEIPDQREELAAEQELKEVIRNRLTEHATVSSLLAVLFSLLTIPVMFPTTLVAGLVVVLLYTSFHWAVNLVDVLIRPSCLHAMNKLCLLYTSPSPRDS